MYESIAPQNLSTPAAPLLVAALVLLHQRCPRNEMNAALLLQRAALSLTLSPAEREVCQNLADELGR